MATRSLPTSHSRARGISPVLVEALMLLLTIIAGVIIVSLLIFAPRAFLGGEPELGRYFESVREYLGGLARGDLGVNHRGEQVSGLLARSALRSLQLLGISAIVALVLGLFWGALLPTVRRGLPGASLYALSTLVLSMPTFVIMLLGIETIATITLRTGVRLAFVTGYGMDKHLVLPVAVLAIRGAAYMSRAVQITQDDLMRQDWVSVARAKGLGGFALWRRHVLPALYLPLIGSSLGMLRVMVSGLIIVDYIYNWGGLGGRLLQIGRDGVIAPSNDQIAAGAAVFFVFFFILIDGLGRLLLSKADPRLREIASE